MNKQTKLITIIMFVAACVNAWALPSVTPANLQASAGVVTDVTGGTLTITAPNKAILSWQNFGGGTDTIALGETVAYTLPSASASVLNVVTGANNTRLDGALTSNGNVFILNPNGIILTGTSRVDVNSLVLSTSDNVAFASFYYQQNGKLPSQDKLTAASGTITVAGGAVGTKEGLHLYSKNTDVGALISQGNLVVNADGAVFLATGGSTYVTGNITVNNDKGNTSLVTNGYTLTVAGNITSSSTTGNIVSPNTGAVNATTVTATTTGDVLIGKVNATQVTATGNNVSVGFDSGLNSTATVTANGTVNVTSPGFLTVNVKNAGTGDTTVAAGGTLTLGTVHNNSTGATTFAGSSVVDSTPGVFVYGPTSFNATGSNIAITRANHSFGPVSINAVGDAVVNEAGALNLNRVIASKLTVKSDDFIFQTPTTGGINAAFVNATATGNVTLNTGNNLYTNVAITGNNVAVASTGPVYLGNVNANNELKVTSGTFISQTADTKVVASGATSFTGTTVTVANAGNQFGQLTVDVGVGTAAITEDSTMNVVSLRAGTAALKSLESVITSGTGSVVADTFNVVAGDNFAPTAILKATNPLTVIAGKNADLSLLSLATNLNGKTPTVITANYKAPSP